MQQQPVIFIPFNSERIVDICSATPLPVQIDTCTLIPSIDLHPDDHNKLPNWMRRFPLFISSEIVNHGVCVMCLLRFLNHRDISCYVTTNYDDLINNILFNEEELQEAVQSMTFQYVPKPIAQDILSKSTTTTETMSDIDNIPQPQPTTIPENYAETQRAALFTALSAMKEQLFITTTSQVCTICLNILHLNDKFLDFIVNVVEREDYEFEGYNLHRTTPSSLSLRQYGLWHLLRHKYKQYDQTLIDHETTEASLFEIKQVLKLQMDLLTQKLNTKRTEVNTSLKSQIETLSTQLSIKNNKIDKYATILTPDLSSTIPTMCNFITPRHEINQGQILFDQASPFRIDIVYYIISPDYSNDLHRALYRADLVGEISTSAAMLRRMVALPIDAMTRWGLSPPKLKDDTIIPLPRPLHYLIPEGTSTNTKNYSTEYSGNHIYTEIDYLPTSLTRFPGVDEFTHYTFMINKYVIAQVSCTHDSVFLEGTYTKSSRMLSQTPWYRDLAFYQVPRDITPVDAKPKKQRKGRQEQLQQEQQDGLMEALNKLSDATQTAELEKLRVINAVSVPVHDEVPVQVIHKRKKRDFEQLSDDDDVKKNRASNLNELANNSDNDEIASLNELDPLFTNGIDDGDEFNEMEDDNSFSAQLNKQIQKEKEKQFSKDDSDINAKNNENKSANPADEDVGEGKLPYAASSVETELAIRIIPYYHPIDKTKSVRNSQAKPYIQKSSESDEMGPDGIPVPQVHNSSTDLASVLHTPQQSFNNIHSMPFRDQHAGYCSMHSTNPNGIPCIHYHRKTIPGPIDNLVTPEEELKDMVDYNNFRLTFYDNFNYKFHSSGREDLNVRMLGHGRPFILELLNPHRNPKNIDLNKLMVEVNCHTKMASITSLHHASQENMTKMDKEISEKRKQYRCVVYSKEAITKELLNDKIDTIHELNIIQNTPVRVMLRRSALPRPRHINNLKATYINPHFFYLDLETQSGTYIKEFVHSDKGRTHPSISSILNSECDILQLDVAGLIL